MAVVQNTLIGRAAGRVGNAVFTTWKGRNILKQKPEIVANPRTGQQVANRTRFVTLLALAKLLRPVIYWGFKEYAGTMSWMNRFMKTNSYSDLLTWNPGTQQWETDYTKLVISEGSLFPTVIDSINVTTTTVEFSWDTSVNGNQMASDVLYAVIIGQNETKFLIAEGPRSLGTETISLASTLGDVVTVAAYFMSTNGEIVSNSYAISGTAA